MSYRQVRAREWSRTNYHNNNNGSNENRVRDAYCHFEGVYHDRARFDDDYPERNESTLRQSPLRERTGQTHHSSYGPGRRESNFYTFSGQVSPREHLPYRENNPWLRDSIRSYQSRSREHTSNYRQAHPRAENAYNSRQAYPRERDTYHSRQAYSEEEDTRRHRQAHPRERDTYHSRHARPREEGAYSSRHARPREEDTYHRRQAHPREEDFYYSQDEDTYNGEDDSYPTRQAHPRERDTSYTSQAHSREENSSHYHQAHPRRRETSHSHQAQGLPREQDSSRPRRTHPRATDSSQTYRDESESSPLGQPAPKLAGDLYKVLNVSQDASHEDIVRAARKRRIEVHPDRRKSPGMTPSEVDRIDDEAQGVGLAADTLCDEVSRGKYDRAVRRGLRR